MTLNETIEQLFKETNRIKKAMAVKVSGQWIPLEKEIGLYECSICGHKILRAECNYCPNCGAKMMNEDKEMSKVAEMEMAYGEYLND